MSTFEVSVYEAKTHLSRLLRRVEAGEVIFIQRGKTTVAKLTAVKPREHASKPDTAKGEVWIADDFNAPMTGLLSPRHWWKTCLLLHRTRPSCVIRLG